MIRLAPILFCVLIPSTASADKARAVLEWSELPALPDKHGFAGPLAGVSGDALIVAGGANFPDGRPWDGAQKVWHDSIFVLTDPNGAWQRLPQKLPAPRAYGVALTWNDAVVCLGGGDASSHSEEAFLMRWTDGQIEFESLPPMPRPVAFFCGALVGDTVYVAGGQESPDASEARHTFWSLDLAQPNEGWKELDAWPGPARILAVAGAAEGDFYLFSGAELIAGPDGKTTRRFLRDAYRYRPRDGWTRLTDLPRAAVAAPTPAFELGADQLAVVGGDDGGNFFRQAGLNDAHPGFPADILTYNTVTDTWTPRGEFPKQLGPDPAGAPNQGTWPPVTTVTTHWRGHVVIPTGEVRPGVRTPRVFWAEPAPLPVSFGLVNWSVLVVYLVALVCIGVYFARRESTTDDYFLAGRRVPWWAAGLSIFGTQLSAITYLAIPAKSYSTDWSYIVINAGILAVAPLVIFAFLPLYRRLNVTTAYEYLEIRFSPGLRLLGSFAFTAFQLGRLGVVVLLPALALSAVTGLDVFLCIAIMGVLSTVYTVAGGIEAVIWTDVLQVIVLMGGALVALLLIVGGVEGGLGSILGEAAAYDKFRAAHLEWDLSSDTLFVVAMAAVFTSFVPYASDQVVIQRYLTTPTERQARRAIWTNALLAIPASLLFFSVGTALFVFYRAHPAGLEPLEKTDQIFPWFIAHQMPPGLAGLVIAGVFAAAMSSLDSSMHSVATTLTTDWYRRFRTGLSEAHYLRIARAFTIALGTLGTGTATLMAIWKPGSLWDVFLAVVGLLGGTMGGLFALGVFNRRAGPVHAWVGVAASALALGYVRLATDLNHLLYAGIGVLTCYLVGSLAALFVPALRAERPLARPRPPG